jgi:hypothetical protein
VTARPGLDPLVFPIETRALIYAPSSRKLVRFDPPRLAVDCPMCEWVATAPNSPGGLTLAEQARSVHASTVHPEAIIAGGLVMPPVAIIRGQVVTRGPRRPAEVEIVSVES